LRTGNGVTHFSLVIMTLWLCSCT